jgi:hypothetical protein
LFGAALTVTAGVWDASAGPCHILESAAALTLDAQVPDGESIMLRASRRADAAISLGVLGPPASLPLLEASLSASTPEWIHLPNTGQPLLWRLRVRTSVPGELMVCGTDLLQFHIGTSLFSASAAGGSLDAPWASAHDSAAYTGLAARLPRGTVLRSRNLFAAPMVLTDGIYDVWYRARVADSSGTIPEMTLGLFDLSAQTWVGGKTYRASALRSSYEWVKAVTGMVQRPGDRLVFIAESDPGAAHLSTDWFIDEGVILPAGSPPPTDITPIA